MDLEQKSVERLKMASEMSLKYYGQPLLIAYSGGKDSDVMLELAIRSGIPFEVQHSHTTADAPETVRHVRKKFYELELKGIKCTINMPYYKGRRVSMWSLIPMKLMPPTRIARYCCEVLKETAGDGRMIATGVRWDESTQRSTRGDMEILGCTKKDKIILTNDNDTRRKFFEKCELRAKAVCNPIIEWIDSEIWEYIHSEKIEVNPLYQCGFYRVGCIGCPMARKERYKQFDIFPKYKNLYLQAFGKMIEVRKTKLPDAPTKWNNAYDVFAWWMGEDSNQLKLNLEDMEVEE